VSRQLSSFARPFPEHSAVQINVSARHGHLSDTTQEKVRVKVERLLRLFERLTAIDVTVDLQDPAALGVDVRVSAEHKHDFVAAATGDELMGVLDGALHKIEQQIRKYKERVQERHRTTQGKTPPEGAPETM
jgi:putative sigma-54 modulation protein